MNEETRLMLELEQAIKRLKQAREKLRRARHDHTIAVAEVDLLQTRLVQVKYGNKPFKERLPRLSAGRPKTDSERYRRKVHHRMIYLELLRRKEDTSRPIISSYAPSLVEDMAAEVHLSEGAIRKSWRLGKHLSDINVF